LLNAECLAGQDLVFSYSGTGHYPWDTFFDHGAFFSTVGIADLRLSVTSSPKSVPPQASQVTYVLTVENAGPGTATDVVVNDSWSKPQTSFNSASSSPLCQSSVQQAVCHLGTLTAGTIVPLTIVLD